MLQLGVGVLPLPEANHYHVAKETCRFKIARIELTDDVLPRGGGTCSLFSFAERARRLIPAKPHPKSSSLPTKTWFSCRIGAKNLFHCRVTRVPKTRPNLLAFPDGVDYTEGVNLGSPRLTTLTLNLD